MQPDASVVSPSSDIISPLLRLPIELRRHIYKFILPSTCTFDVRLQRNADIREKSEFNLTCVRQQSSADQWRMLKTYPRTDRETGNDIVWQRGLLGILAVNHQIHEECVDIIYGDNTFVIHVSFDKILFRYRWLLPSNLTPNRTYPFLHQFSQRNLMRIKNYIINVEHVDDYTGMIKYNCGGRGLGAGIRAQVDLLVDLLALVPFLSRVRVHLIDGAISRVRFPSGRMHRVQDDKNFAASQVVLEPFKRLYGVRQATVTGVNKEYADALEQTMTASRVVPS